VRSTPAYDGLTVLETHGGESENRMAVYKQKNSNKWSYKFAWNGQQIRKSTKQTNKRVAEQMEAAHKTALAKGEVGIREKKPVPTLKEFSPRFEQAIETECAAKPATIKFYKAKLNYLLADESLASCSLDRIDEDLIDTYKQRRRKSVSRHKKVLSAASVNRELATLRRLLRLAQDWGIIDRVPRIRLLRGERTREFVLNYEQEKNYLAATTGDLHDIALLMIDTGLRMGEVLSLECKDVRLEPASGAKYGYLTVRSATSKNSKSRNVPLTLRVSAMLKHRLDGRSEDALVFRRANGGHLVQTWVNEQHRTIRDLLKLPEEFVPHSLRHTFGTRLGESGADAFTIMKLMGHSTITVSQRYVHPSPEAVELAVGRMEAMNGMKLEKLGIVSGIPAQSETQQLQ
jgi:integrase